MNLCTEVADTERDTTGCPMAEEAACCETAPYGSCLTCRRRCTGGVCTDASRCVDLAGCAEGAACGGGECTATSDCPMCCNGTCCAM
jgi:hypothetical protein